METAQDIRHRGRDDQDDGTARSTTTTATEETATKGRRMAMAKGGLKSLSVAVAVPLLLTAADIYAFGTTSNAAAYNRGGGGGRGWVPPLWALHGACLASALLMGAAAWMFWAQDGLRRAPQAAPLYAAQLALSLAWAPLVLRAGASWAGLPVAGALFALLWRCGRLFRVVSPVAGDLVKPCLASAAFLAFASLKLMLASSSGSASSSGHTHM